MADMEKNRDGQMTGVLSRHGELGNFMVRVQHRQNGTWQGRITWVEENRTVNFRSIWEMIKLMENALENQETAGQEQPDWAD
jgi:hypothetical protein